MGTYSYCSYRQSDCFSVWTLRQTNISLFVTVFERQSFVTPYGDLSVLTHPCNDRASWRVSETALTTAAHAVQQQPPRHARSAVTALTRTAGPAPVHAQLHTEHGRKRQRRWVTCRDVTVDVCLVVDVHDLCQGSGWCDDAMKLWRC